MASIAQHMSLRIVLRDQATSRWLEFTNAADIISVWQAGDVMPALQRIEQRVNSDGLWAVGFITYEASAGFDPACATKPAGDLPLLSFGLFESHQILRTIEAASSASATPQHWTLDTSRTEYTDNVARIREQIAAGNTYQINYTIRGRTAEMVDPWSLFAEIAGDVPFAAYLETDAFAIVSASPELFFRLDGNELVSKPMKGTAARGLTAAADALRRKNLEDSAKDRAENVMIADMLRNDMGRVAQAGTVNADSLFDIEKYPTVWQATSTITARTDRPVADIFGALFPCASITGAPKVASMQLITQLEKSPRGVYTGAIGYLAPQRRAQFSVAIRTAHVDRRTGCAEYGVGGGIVWDSRPEDEYAECLAKGSILRRQRPPAGFRLIETLLWTRDSGYFLLDRHLARISLSAEYFDFAIDGAGIRDRLQSLSNTLHGERHRVRLLLAADGSISLSETALGPVRQSNGVRVRLAARPVDADNVFLYHKTTHRKVYDDALAGAGDCDDVLLWNTDGFVTESTIANVAVRIDGQLYTPPVEAGLLAGTLREELLQSGKLVERPVRTDELSSAREVFLLNSVRQMYAVQLL